MKVSQDARSKQPTKANQDFKESTRVKKIIELFCFPRDSCYYLLSDPHD